MDNVEINPRRLQAADHLEVISDQIGKSADFAALLDLFMPNPHEDDPETDLFEDEEITELLRMRAELHDHLSNSEKIIITQTLLGINAQIKTLSAMAERLKTKM